MTKTARESALRNTFTEKIVAMLMNADEEVLRVGANEVSLPCVDVEGYETFVNIKISVPRGTRSVNGGYNEYNGYTAAEAYKEEVAENAEKQKAAEAKKAAKIAADEKRRAERAAKAAEREAKEKGE